MKPYPVYKDSGIEWIGEIPEHWEIKKLKYLTTVIMGQSPSSDDYNSQSLGLPFLQGNAEFTNLYPLPKIWCHTANKEANNGDILVSVRAPIGAVNIANQKYGIGRGLCAIRGHEAIKQQYLYYLFILLEDELNSVGTGSTYKAISSEQLQNRSILKLPLSEQQNIVAFLENKTSQIDTLIEKKQRQIELLKEERTAIINQAVTKGLNPDVPMKDSGIEWLGEVPEHWEIMKLKYVSNIFFSNVDKKTNDGETIVRSCNYVDVYNNEVITEDINFLNISATKSEISKFLIKEGDVLATKDSETPDDIAVPALVKCSFTDVVCGYHLAIIRPLSIIGEYLFRLLQSEINYHFFIQAKGITRFGLSTDSFNNLLIPLPPMSEQLDIILHIKEKLSLSESLIDKIQNQITFLQEYRTAIISNAVTGKIDLRNYHGNST